MSADRSTPSPQRIDPIYQWLIITALGTAVFHFAVVAIDSRVHFANHYPMFWYALISTTASVVIGICVSFTAFGQFLVNWDPPRFWTMVGFAGFSLFALPILFAFPEIPPGERGYGAQRFFPYWPWHLMFTALGVSLLLAVLAPWPNRTLASHRSWRWLARVVAALVLGLVAALVLDFNEFSLPSLDVSSTPTSPARVWSFVLIVVFVVGAVLSARRYARTREVLFKLLPFTQLFVAFILAVNAVGTMRSGAESVETAVGGMFAFAIILFGLLTDYVQLFSRERAKAQRLESLQAITEALVRDAELSRVAEVVVTQCLDVLQADAGALWLVEPSSMELTFLASSGLSAAFVEGVRERTPIPAGMGLMQPVDGAYAIHDVATSEVPLLDRQRLLDEGLRGLVFAPLRIHDRIVGYVGYASRAPRRDSSADIALLRSFADLFAVALENARLSREVRRNLRLREEFIAAAAHELRSPVTVIHGRTEFTLKTDAKEANSRRAFEETLQATRRISRLTDDLLAVARIQSAAFPLVREQLDLDRLTRSVVDEFKVRSLGHDIHIPAGEEVFVRADEDQIRDALSRILENAVRHAPESQPVEVDVKHMGDTAVVSVTYRGKVIPIERQVNAFEPFYEIFEPGVPGYVGQVSLGLYLSKWLVEANGGRIWLTSDRTKGTTISFSLPLGASDTAIGPRRLS